MSACPACGEPLFGWLLVGPDANGNPNDSVLLERCEHCRLGVAADLAPANTPSALLGFARQIPEGRFELRVANRASVQASLGGSHWAALERQRGLYPTPQSLPPLAAAAGLEIEELRCPRPRWKTRQLRHRSRRPIDGVEEYLGRQSAGQGMRVVDLVVGVPSVRRNR